MTNLYIVLGPLFGFVLFDRIRKLNRAIKRKNIDQTKVHVLFLSLIIVVEGAVFFLIWNMDS